MTRSTWRAVVVGLVVVVAAVGGLLLLSVLADRGTIRARLGDEEFRAGRVDVLADQVEADGPILYPGLGAGRDRDLFVHHLAPAEVDEGWVAFSARAPEQDDRACTLRWDPTGEGRFVDPCTGARFAPDGTGLERYATRLDGEGDDAVLYVDLRTTVAG